MVWVVKVQAEIRKTAAGCPELSQTVNVEIRFTIWHESCEYQARL